MLNVMKTACNGKMANSQMSLGAHSTERRQKKRKRAVKTKGKARRHLLNPLKGRKENFHMVLRCHILMFFSSSSSLSFLSLPFSCRGGKQKV
jgi:hypothetical protein